MTSIASGSPSGLPPRLARVAHLAQRRVGDETVVVDLRNSRVFGLNPAGGELLEAMREGRELSEVQAWAAAGGDRGAVAAFLGELLGAGLVAPAEDAAAEGPLAMLADAPSPWVAILGLLLLAAVLVAISAWKIRGMEISYDES